MSPAEYLTYIRDEDHSMCQIMLTTTRCEHPSQATYLVTSKMGGWKLGICSGHRVRFIHDAEKSGSQVDKIIPLTKEDRS